MIQVGKNLLFINKGGTSFILLEGVQMMGMTDARAQDMTTRQQISNVMIGKQ
jgi:hypothetical protein